MSDSEAAQHEWVAEVVRLLGLGEFGAQEQGAVLDLVRDVAHNVARPAAPLTAYLLGVAVGRGADRAAVQETLTELVERRQIG